MSETNRQHNETVSKQTAHKQTAHKQTAPTANGRSVAKQGARPQLRSAPQAQTGGKKGSKRKGLSFAGVLCILLVVVMAVVFSFTYFNIAGFKGLAVNVLGLTEQADIQANAILKEAEKQHKAGQQELDTAERELLAKEKEIKQREKDIAAKEDALLAREADLSAQQEQQQQLADRQQELTAMVQTLEGMDAKKAAEVISGLTSVSDIATILSKMDSPKAAAILNNMNSELSTKVLAEIIRYSG